MWLFGAAQPLPAAGPDCPAPSIDEQGQVKSVVDGDTLHLQDGRSVRLIGINTPEIFHDGRPAEPLAEAARSELLRLIDGKAVALDLGAERRDRHGRTLAHVYTASGIDVQAELLQQGLAFTIAVPPNTDRTDCYLALEQAARAERRGLWTNAFYDPIEINDLGAGQTGFLRVSGRINRIGQSREAIWLNMDNRFALRVERHDLGQFTASDPLQWLHRKIIARGWIYPYKDQRVMQVRHPAAIEFIE